MIRRRGRQRGLSLVELMIAMIIGVVVVGTATTVFLGNSRSSDISLSLAEVQGRARMALDELSAGARLAGYRGCAGSVDAVPAVPVRRNQSATVDPDWRAIDGHRVAGADWLPRHPAGYTPPLSPPGVPVEGSDALSVEGGVLQGVTLARSTFDGVSVDVVSDQYPGLEPGAMALVADCTKAEAFHIDSTSARIDGGTTLATVAPLAGVFELATEHPLAARVMPYRRALYYIGDTGRRTPRGEAVRALYEHLHPYPDTTPTELAAGVEAMVVHYRQRTAGGAVTEHRAGDPGFDPDRVIGVRIGLLISARESAEQFVADTFLVAGIPVVAGAIDAPGFPDDQRLRRVFERTITLRNRDSRR